MPDNIIDSLNSLGNDYSSLEELVNKILTHEFADKLGDSVKNLSDSFAEIPSGVMKLKRLYTSVRLEANRLLEQLKDIGDNYSKVPGKFRLIIPDKSIDAHFGNTRELNIIENNMGTFLRQIMTPQLTAYLEQFGDWQNYLRDNPSERPLTIVFKNNQLGNMDTEFKEVERLKRPEEAETPDQLFSKLVDVYDDHKGFIKKEYPDFYMTIVEPWTWTLDALDRALVSKDEGKIKKIYQEIMDRYDEVLAKYPKIRELL